MCNTVDRPANEVAEIERHKYFLSEKAGRDVGWEQAEKDWEIHFASEYRRIEAASEGRGGIGFLFKRLFTRSTR